MNVEPHKLVFTLGLFVVVMVFVRGLIASSRNGASPIKLDHLLLDDQGRMSKPAVVLFGSFIVTSWVIVQLMWTDKLTEGYFGTYCLTWVGPTLLYVFKPSGAPITNTTIVNADQVSLKPAAQQLGTTTTTSSTTTQQGAPA